MREWSRTPRMKLQMQLPRLRCRCRHGQSQHMRAFPSPDHGPGGCERASTLRLASRFQTYAAEAAPELPLYQRGDSLDFDDRAASSVLEWELET